MAAFNRILVCLYVAIAALPLAVMAVGLRDHKVFGALPRADKPELSIAGFRSEAYQQAYTAWFESHLGWKGYSIATDNSILYHVFRDTKPGSAVALGRRGVLFKDEDVWYYNKDGADLPTEAAVDALADKIAALQTRLAAHHRGLVPVIIPSKTSLYRDAMPPIWTRGLGQPRPSDVAIYRAMVRALEARKVRYVDARALLTAPGVVREQVWSRQARHWSPYGACLAMAEIARAHTALTGAARPAYDCPHEPLWPPETHVDDLWSLLNVWHPPPRLDRVAIGVKHAPPPDAPGPSVMLIGTSFCWTLLHDAFASKWFGAIHMDYYNKTLIEWPAGIRTAVHPHTPAWRSVFLTRDLYVLDLFEVFLLSPSTYVDEFLAEVGGEIERTLPAP